MKRRKFLKNSSHLAFTSAYFYGVQSLLEACFHANFAKAAEGTELRYVNIQTTGAPPRWYFDQPLNPANKAGEFIAGEFGTELRKQGGVFRPVHVGYRHSFGGKDVFLPPVWRLSSAHSGQKFSSLLAHTMMFRGIDMEINGHNVNRTRTIRPVASQPSITGMLADQSKLPLAAAGFAGLETTTGFRSERGLSTVEVSSGNPTPAMTSAFTGKVTKASDLPRSITQAVESMDQYAIDHGLSSQGFEEAQTAAYEMFDKNIANFNKEYKALFDKYTSIIKKELKAAFPGINSGNPTADDSEYFNVDRNDKRVTGGLNASIDGKTTNNNLAASCAFAEFALTKNLSTAVTVNSGGTILQNVKGVGNIVCDQHFVGASSSVYYTSLFWRAKLGCILELKNQLDAAGLFDNTLIHVTAEFSRTPKSDASGSDHGFNGSSSTLFSGMISTPGLVGNIRKQPNRTDKARYPGSFGESANFLSQNGKNRPLLNDDLVNTICEILEVKKVATKGLSLVIKSGGKVQWSKAWGFRNV